DHIDHIRNLIGASHIGLGGDYDGMPPGPVGLEDVSTYPALLKELLRRGYSDEEVAGIAGGNVLRVMKQAEAVAARLQQEKPASDALIDELDAGLPVPAD
ncbi:MAG: membrane dipeptidase, partial [Proteobacteria bacterium]|nr:membrane dipeptidase [Pseudomonadota bacterium]